MELVTKKRLHLVAGRVNRELAEEVARAPRRRPGADGTSPSSPTARSTAGSASRSAAPTCSSSRATARPPEHVDQRRADGAADHGRRRQARLGQAHHRRGARSTGTAARTARPRAASPSPPSCSPTCSRSPGPSAWCRSTCTPVRSRASSTARSTTSPPCPCWSTGWPQNLPEDLVVVSPDAGRVKVAERYANQLHADIAIVHKRRVKRCQEHGRGQGGRRRGRGPHLRAHRRHDRHRRHHRRRGRAAGERGASAVYCAAHPRRVLGPGHRPAQELAHREGRHHQHAAAAAREAASTRSRCSRRRGIIADAIDAVFEDTSVSEIFDGQNQH